MPAIVSGLMWGVATACWFVSNQTLSEPVAFPIITTGPGAVASLFWGVMVFKEIKVTAESQRIQNYIGSSVLLETVAVFLLKYISEMGLQNK